MPFELVIGGEGGIRESVGIITYLSTDCAYGTGGGRFV
jgi:hypothetical protein